MLPDPALTERSERQGQHPGRVLGGTLARSPEPALRESARDHGARPTFAEASVGNKGLARVFAVKVLSYVEHYGCRGTDAA